MPLPPELSSIADRLIGHALKNRNERIRLELQRREHNAVRAGIQDRAYYPHELKEACIREMNDRLDTVWATYQRVITEAAIPWTQDIHDEVLGRIESLLVQDARHVEELARGSITNHGHSFDVFLTNESPGMLDRMRAEIELFALRYRPLGVAVLLQLQAKRYVGPRRHWIEVQSVLRASPPKLAHAAQEAIHAVEGLARIVANRPKLTLGKCIEELRKSRVLDGGLANGLDSLWGLASNAQGVRHGAASDEAITPAKAEYIIGQSEVALKLLLSLDALTA